MSIVFAKDRWPSIPPIPGALQVEGQVSQSTYAEMKSNGDRPSGTESAPDTKQDLFRGRLKGVIGFYNDEFCDALRCRLMAESI